MAAMVLRSGTLETAGSSSGKQQGLFAEYLINQS
jgi:hypothetical protein